MARLWTSGAESRAALTEDTSTYAGTGCSVTFDTTIKRSPGLVSWKCASVSNGQAEVSKTVSGTVAGRHYYGRAYFYVSALPAANHVDLMQLITSVSLESTGYITLYNSTTATTYGPFGPVQTGTWFCVEAHVMVPVSGNGVLELRINGTTVYSNLSENIGTATLSAFNLGVGWNTGTGTECDVWVDDIALNDDQGTAQNTWCADGYVLDLVPSSDNARASWTEDASGTTNLFQCVDNKPPAGAADGAANGAYKQIRNAASAANNDYKANLPTYTAAGIGATDTIDLVQLVAAVAAPVTSGAKSAALYCVSNPVETAPTAGTTVWSGSAAGAFPTGWKLLTDTPLYAPTVTLGTAPVIAIRQITASTRIALCCYLALRVEASPPVSTTQMGQGTSATIVAASGFGRVLFHAQATVTTTVAASSPGRLRRLGQGTVTGSATATGPGRMKFPARGTAAATSTPDGKVTYRAGGKGQAAAAGGAAAFARLLAKAQGTAAATAAASVIGRLLFKDRGTAAATVTASGTATRRVQAQAVAVALASAPGAGTVILHTTNILGHGAVTTTTTVIAGGTVRARAQAQAGGQASAPATATRRAGGRGQVDTTATATSPGRRLNKGQGNAAGAGAATGFGRMRFPAKGTAATVATATSPGRLVFRAQALAAGNVTATAGGTHRILAQAIAAAVAGATGRASGATTVLAQAVAAAITAVSAGGTVRKRGQGTATTLVTVTAPGRMKYTAKTTVTTTATASSTGRRLNKGQGTATVTAAAPTIGRARRQAQGPAVGVGTGTATVRVRRGATGTAAVAAGASGRASTRILARGIAQAIAQALATATIQAQGNLIDPQLVQVIDLDIQLTAQVVGKNPTATTQVISITATARPVDPIAQAEGTDPDGHAAD